MLNLGIGAGDAEPVRPRAEQSLCGVGCGAKADVHAPVSSWQRGATEAHEEPVWCGGGWGASKGKDGLEGFAAMTRSCLRGQEERGDFCLGVGF